ncbi:hypothetical protein BpHYR1_021192 [Brachionus plicatilis]|uniref:Uncharacterized protein n=1 Tax=Brachionus plicatilis TaxID=10195 RepID=A0A3M7TAS9_BRAPC|nr:hypothetical protein BpHYR1_021192 [Brachionus plicatilis]
MIGMMTLTRPGEPDFSLFPPALIFDLSKDVLLSALNVSSCWCLENRLETEPRIEEIRLANFCPAKVFCVSVIYEAENSRT